MFLVTEDAIADELGVSAEVAYRVARHLLEARAYLRELKGRPWYDAHVVSPPGERPRGPHSGATLRTHAERAEALLALYYALPLLNLSLADGGGVLAVVYATTPATGDAPAGSTQTRFATSDDLDGLRRDLLDQARLLVGGDVAVTYSGTDSTLIESVDAYGRGGRIGAI